MLSDWFPLRSKPAANAGVKSNGDWLMSLSVRIGIPEDFKEIRSFDEFWGDRRQEIQRGELFVCINDNLELAGFISLTRSCFFDYPFISYLCVKDKFKRQGVAKFMLDFINEHLGGAKHFTSTEIDNIEARSLFEKAGYTFSGELSYLDDDKEVIYVKVN